MAHSAVFRLDGKERAVNFFSFHLFRLTDEIGRPSSRIRQAKITLTLASDGMHKEAIINWLAEPDQAKEGEVTIYEDDEKTKVLKTFRFENAFVIDYHEAFDDASNLNTSETFSINCDIIMRNIPPLRWGD